MRRLLAGAALLSVAVFAGALAAPQTFVWHLPPGVTPPPVPPDNPMSDAKVALGRRLFYDADLSLDGTTSCATCHEQHRAFTEGNASHPGVGGVSGRRNVMGLSNVAYLDPLTWADSTQHRLERQMLVPVSGTHPVEMGMAGKEQALSDRLGGDPCYRQMFAAAFPDSPGTIDMPHIGLALASFERTTLSFNAPYDRFRRGDKSALDSAAQQGLSVFFGAGHCAACHAGDNFTDGKFHHIGLYEADETRDYPRGDHGLREITGREADEGAFRTPILRNVSLTGPYMHDGSVRDLREAILRHFQGNNSRRDAVLKTTPPSPAQLDQLVAFLQSLTDQAFVNNPDLALPKTVCGKPNY